MFRVWGLGCKVEGLGVRRLMFGAWGWVEGLGHRFAVGFRA